ncbi:MAG: sugar phosphate isomerase/epimerase [Phycisphaerae bacterium]|nr:sugar phosphate isomerase/epimerase [Phycisphaerae bacterium]
MPLLSVIAPFGFSFDPARFLSAYHTVGVRSASYYRNESNQPALKDVLAAARAAGMSFDSMHGVFGFHLDPCSPDPEHRRHCLLVYEREGLLARDLGGPAVVVHPSAWNPDRKLIPALEAETLSEPRWAPLDDFMRRLAEIGQRLGVTYLMENQPLNCPLGHDWARLAEAVRAVGHPRIRVCLDTGHAHMCGDVVRAVRDTADVVELFHVHDNNGSIDDHRMPGEGTIDWPAFARTLVELNINATRMVEVFYDEARVERLARKGLKDTLKSACAV